ncbi:protein TolR [Candidatus Binatia bacterium]|jgi:biopolymer transport protein TolR|nr:protein TolR [Candidatus Binatia bacterium]
MAFDAGDRSAGSMSQINVTPLVDVMLVLLVIFMVTAPIIQQGVSVDLPDARAGALNGKDEQLVVSVTKKGSLYLNDTAMSAADLETKLRAIAAQRPDGQVFVRADKSVPYGEVVAVMAAIKQSGIRRVGMVTALPPGDG